MTAELFAPRAARELESAAVSIASDDPQAAEAFLQSALVAARRLAGRPALGSTRPYVPSRYRFWALRRYHYLLVYDTLPAVRIVRVVHMRRDLPKLLARLRDDRQAWSSGA